MKEGKTLLLTTHFMEESDALSDRIMIIANGNIKADGTSAKLKEQYGSGKISFVFFLSFSKK
jgi:ABC-type multidrug transport system ATPase subunit